MEFIGREEEQRAIQALLSSDGYKGCVIYGRRRMGKTELVKHCLMGKDIPCVMYQCKESSELDNAALFTQLLRDTLNIPYLFFEHFMDAVSFLFDYAKDKDVYFVLDEYPYLRNVIKGCDSKLQSIIDKHAMDSHMKFFLLGSSISTMEDVLAHKSPLYMRFSLSILLKQMDYYDSAKFYPSFSEEDKVSLYAAFGGVPFYNAQIDKKVSVKENIIRLLSGQFSGLKEFLDTYLKEELRKINNANVVFEAIALGAYHYSDILSESHIGTSALLNVTLQKLIKMDLIEYQAPINDKSNKKKAGYRISDFCVRFYYRFIYKNSSSHKMASDEVFYDKFIKEEFENEVVPKTFETITKQYIVRENKRGKFDPIFLDIGTYWYDNPVEKKNGQFDVVAKSELGYVFFECKFTKDPIDDIVIKEELSQVAMTNLIVTQYGFVSKNGFELKGEYPYLFFTLQDLYR